MQEIIIPVEGTSPLLQHNPLGMAANSDKLGKKKIPTPEEEAEAGTYRMPDGQLYLPSSAFRGSLLGAAKGRKFGKVYATTVVKGAVFVLDDATPLNHPDGTPLKDYEIDTRRAVVQRNGVLRSRPKLNEWAADVVFEIDEEFIAEDQVRELLGIAGRIIGVGDYRPEKSGPFGRFRVL